MLLCSGYIQKASLRDCVHGSTGSFQVLSCSVHYGMVLLQCPAPLLGRATCSASVGSIYECKLYVAMRCCSLLPAAAIKER